MIKIGVVEDDNEQLDVLLEYIKKYFVEHGYNYTVEVFGTATAFQGRKERDFDIIFMDIMLPDGNGWELVKQLREKDKNTIIIFTTNMLQYAVKGYEVRAFDFIVKPFNYNNFALKLESALEMLASKVDDAVWINGKNFQKRVYASQIYYIETQSHYITFHTNEGDFSMYGTLAGAQKMVSSASFALCNRCYLVNLNYVSGIDGEYAKVKDDMLLISRNKRASFLKALNEYVAAGGTLNV